MRLDEWHSVRDGVLRDRNPIRLDCLNPFQALDGWKYRREHPLATPDELLEAFREMFDLGHHELLLTKGVRSLLRSFMRSNTGMNSRWLLPADVFPAYQELAVGAGVAFDVYTTWPSLNLNVLARHNDRTILLLPTPHSPTGDGLSAAAVETLVAWLESSPTNYLVLDMVYAYGLDSVSKKLRSRPDVISAYSMSKSWLQRCLAGWATIPNELAKEILPFSEYPTAEECGLAMGCLRHQEDLPAFQEQCFKSRWNDISSKLEQISPGWDAPPTGYLAAINVPWKVMLEDFGVLGVPPALFGSESEDTTVISCLHDLPMYFFR